MSLETWGYALENIEIQAPSLLLHPGPITAWSHCAPPHCRCVPTMQPLTVDTINPSWTRTSQLKTRTALFCRLIVSDTCYSSEQ